MGFQNVLVGVDREAAGAADQVAETAANLLQAKTIDAKREKISAPSAENSSWTTPEELTATILYLLSDEAGSVNGAKIPLYGSN